MTPREELAALRRMAELEAKAAGQSMVEPQAQLSEIPTRQRSGPLDFLTVPFQMGESLAQKPRKEQVEFIAPAVEALGTAGGAILGTVGATPGLGTLAGAGAGFAGAKELMRLAAGDAGAETLPQSAARQAKNVLEGATMEAFGRGVVAPVIGKGAEYVSKLKNALTTCPTKPRNCKKVVMPMTTPPPTSPKK
jgi:hypothetical protein